MISINAVNRKRMSVVLVSALLAIAFLALPLNFVVKEVKASELSNQSPVASFTRSTTAGPANYTISFDASSSYDPAPNDTIVNYFWTFGDGTNATGITASHVYSGNRVYQVTLTVADQNGATSSANELIMPGSKMQISPSDLTIGQLGVNLPTPMVTVNITVSNCTNLYGWQATVVYNEEILGFDEANASVRLPPGSTIFGNMKTFALDAVVTINTRTHKSSVTVGATLLPLPGASLVNGSGLLAQLQFTGRATGSTDMSFEAWDPNDLSGGAYTYIAYASSVDSSTVLKVVPDYLVGAGVAVLGNGISMALNPKQGVDLGESLNITGSLFPQAITEVKISYRLINSTEDWQTLATVSTQRFDINDTYWEARYSYIWKPDKAGTYQLKAEGGGYTSQIKKITVSKGESVPQLGIEFYAPVALIAVGAVGGFFWWDRRRRHSGRLILP